VNLLELIGCGIGLVALKLFLQGMYFVYNGIGTCNNYYNYMINYFRSPNMIVPCVVGLCDNKQS